MKFLLLAVAFSLPAAASDFSDKYPTGSIRDAEQARAALKDADAEISRIAQSAKQRDSECYRGLLVNACRDDVRREKQLAEHEVQRVRVEARDLQRRIDAQSLGERRGRAAESNAREDARRPEKEAARAAAAAREAEVAQRRGVAPALRDPARPANNAGSERSQSRLTAQERAENARKFQEKQEQAQKRARERSAERERNQQRRAEKLKQIEQKEAEREAIRAKAEAAIKTK